MLNYKFYFIIPFLVSFGNAQAQTGTRNYITTETVLVKGQATESAVDALGYSQKRTHVDYYDGLGRLMQANDYQASGDSSKDLVTPVVYDAYGRQYRDYLPFASAQNMAYLSTATASSNWTGYYGSTDGIYAYSEKTYDNSPLNRVVEQSAPGETWKTGSGHTLKYAYGTNTSSEVMDYTINNSTNLLNTTASAYAASTLYKTTTWDENVTTPTESANRTVEYKDKQGRVVLKRGYIGTTAYSTYYVYNDKGLLCCVIPPKATADDGSISSTELAQLCYQYLYDGRDRLIEKKLPGADWAYLVYDKRDRLVLSQTAVQRANGYWLFTKYDAFNRPVLTGKYESSLSRTSLQTTVDAETVMYESSGSVVLGYTNNAFPRISDAGKYLSATYYDSYTTPSTWGYSYSQVYSTETRTDNVKGQVTGIRAKIPDTGTWLYTVNYYDKYGRLLQQYQTNPEGGNNRVSYSYNFVGQVTTKQTLHKKTSSSTAITLNESFTYDHMGRQLTCKFGYNTTTLTTLATNTYDDLGRLSTKQQHNGLQYCDYSYNIRGWLTKINDPGVASTTARLFAMQLYYDTDMTTTLNGTAQYNGNINGIKWRQYNSGSNLYKGYNFTYDGLNRLTQGDYGTYSGSWTNSSAYDLTSAAYDANGNITGLTRKNSSGSNRESLTYTNTGNQLGTVSGTYEGTSGKSGSYSYDSNGNLTSDGLRGLTISYYKELDLPSQYYKDASNKVVYQYDALGVKWGKTATISGSSATTLYYGPFIYQGGSLVKVLTPEGYYVPDPTTPLYHYYLKDHLGNTRMTYHYSGSNPTVDQEEEYYPFGSLFTDNNLTENKYLYNGKELQDEFFENYDYGARFYDAQLGRWHSPDPMAEIYYSWSNYNYCLNDPIRFIDPNGMKVTKTDTSYVVTGDDVYTYYSALSYINQGSATWDNLYEALDKASQKNKGKGGAFDNTLNEFSGIAFKNDRIPWIETAKGEIGQKEVPTFERNNPKIMEYLYTTGSWWENDETAWCSAFSNWTFIQNGIRGTNNARALSWNQWGISLLKPAYGSLAVFDYGGGSGHVGYVVGITSGGSLVILGGNQSNQVKYSNFKTDNIINYVYPTGYIVSPSQYNLPLINNNGSNGNISSTR